MLVKLRLPFAVVILVAVLAGGPGCETSGSTHAKHLAVAGTCVADPTPIGGQLVRGCLTAADQIIDGTSVTVTSVEIRGASGWIVLHTNEAGEPGPRIGLVRVQQGRSTNVLVPAARRLTTAFYWPMLHIDAGRQGVYEFPIGPDVPVVDSQGMVMKLIHVTVR
jgi:hypothetical protein